MTATLKQVYMTSIKPDAAGNFYKVAQFDDTIDVAYPFTAQPIPDELKDKVARFDWSQNAWVDSGVDPAQSQINELKAANKTLSQELTQSRSDLKSANDAIAALTLQVAQLSVAKEVAE